MKNTFDELERSAWGGFLATHSALTKSIEKDLQDRCKLTHNEFEILLRLSQAENGRLRIQDIAAKSILTRSGTSRMVERLEKAGFLNREQAPEDKRGAYAQLSEFGREKFKEAANGHIELVKRKFLNKLGQQELEQLASIWRRLGE